MNIYNTNETILSKHSMMTFFVLMIAASCFPQLGFERYVTTGFYILGFIGVLYNAIVAIGKLWRYTKLDRGLLLILQSIAIGGHVWLLQNPQLTFTGRIGPFLFCAVAVIVTLITVGIVWSLGRLSAD